MLIRWVQCSFVSVLFFLYVGSAYGLVISKADNTFLVVDGSSTFASVDVLAGDFLGGTGTISKVVITVDFAKCDDPALSSSSSSCIGLGNSFNQEIAFSLISPLGTTVDLVRSDLTYDGQTPGARVQVTFDDDALIFVGGNELLSGIFSPEGALSDFLGESALGAWRLFIEDTNAGDPLAYFRLQLDITVDDPVPVPLPSTIALLLIGLQMLYFFKRTR